MGNFMQGLITMIWIIRSMASIYIPKFKRIKKTDGLGEGLEA